MGDVFIYVLIDPRDQKFRYVGKTIDIKKRYDQHIYGSKKNKTKKDRWISKLLKLGLRPLIEVIHKTTTIEYEYWEEFYIKKYKLIGYDLVNYDEKGVGTKHKSREFLKKATASLRKKIIQYNLDGEKINMFHSMREAELKTGINHGNIGRVCNYIWKHAGGYIFRYENDTQPISKLNNPNSQKKRVDLLDENGVVLKTYTSIADAALKNGIDASMVSKICNEKIKNNFKNFKFHNK